MNAPTALALAEQPHYHVTETSASAAASKANALVEARYIMAIRNPRNWDQVRQDLLKECRRPSFADNKTAYYVKPIGDGVEGLGIRFVEVAIRCMKNISVDSEMTFEDESKEVHRVEVTDLESNVTHSGTMIVSKYVERSRPADDGSFISSRKNSWGKTVYLVPAKGDELLNIRGALNSKTLRTLGLRHVPGYLQDEATDIIKSVRLDRAAQGDLYLRRIDTIPPGLVEHKAEGGVFILAHSETLHNHVIEARPNIKFYATDDPLLSYLEVIEATDKAEAVIEHLRSWDTHESLAVPPGVYEIRRQREYSPEGWRHVAD